MAEGKLSNELQSLNQDITLRTNDQELRKALASIYSRGNFARASRTYSTSGATLDYREGLVRITATGSITLIVPYANYWGDNRSTILLIAHEAASGLTVLTRKDATNTINGGVDVTINAGEVMALISDGGTNWHAVWLENKVRSGVHTPTLTAVTLITSSTAYGGHYSRTVDRVTWAGAVGIDSSGAGIIQLGVSLPVASNFSDSADLSGVAVWEGGSPYLAGRCFADTANDRMTIAIDGPNSAAESVCAFHCTYEVK